MTCIAIALNGSFLDVGTAAKTGDAHISATRAAGRIWSDNMMVVRQPEMNCRPAEPPESALRENKRLGSLDSQELDTSTHQT